VEAPAPARASASNDDPWAPGGGAPAPAASPPPAPTPPAPPPTAETPVPLPPAPGSAAGDPWAPGGGATSAPTPPATPPAPPERTAPAAPSTPPVAPAPKVTPPSDDPWSVPGGGAAPPPAPPPVAAPPAEAPPDRRAPDFGTPATPDLPPPVEPPAAKEPTGEFAFTPPDEKRAQAHADRLRASPGDAALEGYPADLVPRSAADVALSPGAKPVIVIFYADNARASHRQAAELLPLLVKRRASVDVVPVDVSTEAQAKWSAAEKKLVRTYYLSYVPTTVVLSPDRKPALLQYQQVTAAVVDAALATSPR
jgi:hypothetical protein